MEKILPCPPINVEGMLGRGLGARRNTEREEMRTDKRSDSGVCYLFVI